jgi:hypothetical protein
MNESDTLPSYDIKYLNLSDYNNEIQKIILINFKNYKKLETFYCDSCHLDKLPDLPNSLLYLYCSYNNLTKLPKLPNSIKILFCCYNNLIELDNLPNSLIIFGCNYNKLTILPDLPNSLKDLYCRNNSLNLNYSDLEIKTINQTNGKNKAIKRMKLLNKTLLLEHSAVINMNPKRIERLLNTNEINFFDGSFDTLTY